MRTVPKLTVLAVALAAATWAAPGAAAAAPLVLGEGLAFKVLAPEAAVRLIPRNERGGVTVGVAECNKGSELTGVVVKNTRGFSISLRNATGQLAGSEPCGETTVLTQGLPWTMSSTSTPGLLKLAGTPEVRFTLKTPKFGETCIYQVKVLKFPVEQLEVKPLPFEPFIGLSSHPSLPLDKALSTGPCQTHAAFITLPEVRAGSGELIYVHATG